MKKFRFIFFSLVALAFVVGAIVAIRSQKDDANLLARHLGNWTSGFDVSVNEQTKGTSASFTDYPVQLFPSLESPSKKAEIDTVLVEGIPTAENHNIARRWNKALSLLPDSQRHLGFSGIHYDLRNEGKHTVLHLYIYAPADTMKNFWLASHETAIVDLKTGKNYRAIGTVPDCFGKFFTFKCERETVLDFQILFPKLPRSTTEIAIYGVPYLDMNGERLTLNQKSKKKPLYDEKPQYHMPKLAKEVSDEYKNYGNIYTDIHTIKPVEEGTMALWRTPEATYVAYAYEMNYTREQFNSTLDVRLFNELEYGVNAIDVLGFPTDHDFWIEGYSGDCVAIIYVFPPISLDNEELFLRTGKNAVPKIKRKIYSVEELRDNQKLFKYKKREVVSK